MMLSILGLRRLSATRNPHRDLRKLPRNKLPRKSH
jgi:hypothetical protein